MKFLLDSNICIHYLRGHFNLNEKINLHEGIYAISEITLAELIVGAEKSNRTEHNLGLINELTSNFTLLPIIDAIPIYAKEKVRLQQAGKMISDFDLLIGCTAIAHSLILVTENTKDFNRINNIQIENWIER